MLFASPEWLWAALLLPVFWFVLRRRGKIGSTHVGSLGKRPGSRILIYLPGVMLSLGFLALVVAMARPQEVFYDSDVTVKARDIIIAVDKSGSMSSPISGPLPRSVVGVTDLDREWPGKPPKPNTPVETFRGQESHSRLEVAQAAVLDFVRNRYAAKAGDRIGIMVFDDTPVWSWPLTHDLKMIYRKVRFVDEGTGGGTNFGNYPPGPVDMAAEHFDELGKAKSRVMIMVTDGENDLTPQAKSRIADIIAKWNVRFYVIGVGETMSRGYPDIMRLAESVGGHVFGAETSEDMQKIFLAIDQLERSDISTYGAQKRKELFMPFALAALLLLTVASLVQALIHNE